MSKTLRESLIEAIEDYRSTPPKIIQKELEETYPAITLEDAKRVQGGLLSLLDAGGKEELHQREREYKALHTELKKKYRKSGKQ